MYEEISDRELMVKITKGDKGAHDALLTRYKGMLFFYIQKKCKNRAIAEELTQEVWLKMFMKAKVFLQSGAEFEAYLIQTAKNTYIDFYRKKELNLIDLEHEQELEINDFKPNKNDPEEQTMINEETYRIRYCIDQLSYEHQEIFHLHETGRYDINSLAEALSLKKEAAKSRLRYAVNKIRECLGI